MKGLNTDAGSMYAQVASDDADSELIRRYRTNHPEFPHESTLDQFFDEEQFEAYRQLGVHAARGLFSPCLMNGESDPAKIKEWFRRLAQNLLFPNHKAQVTTNDEQAD